MRPIPDHPATPPPVAPEATHVLPNAKERRLVMQLLHYWAGLDRRGQGLPPIHALNPQGIPALWHNCYLVWLGAPGGPAYDHVGGIFAQDSGADLTSRSVGSAPPGTLLATCADWFDTVLTHGEPVTFGGTLEHASAGHFQVRGIILPFADGDSGIGYLLGAASQRAVRTATAGHAAVQGYVFRQSNWAFGEVAAPAA